MWQAGVHGKGVCGQGGMCGGGVQGGMCGRGHAWGHAWQGVRGGGACVARRHAWQGEACVAGETATAVDGTHPTGMHSC